MKKLIPILLLLSACRPEARVYVNHTAGAYAVADDTLLIHSDLIINRSGWQKFRHGKLLPKQHQVRQWTRNSLDAPVIRFDCKHAYWNNTIYRLVP